MSENSQPHQKRRCTWTQVIVGLIASLLIVAWLAMPTIIVCGETGEVTKGISNCRQIITAMRIYSSDHDGKYPDAELTDPQNSNEVIRKLFTEGILNNELIIGCPVSPFVPDGNIGHPDDKTFSKAVEAGENHWAMTKGLKDSSPPEIPLVYENPVKPTWPPVWNADAAETNKRGRSWKNGIIIGLNDSSVGIQPLESKKGTAVALKKKDGKDPFEAAIDPTTFPKGEVLNVE